MSNNWNEMYSVHSHFKFQLQNSEVFATRDRSGYQNRLPQMHVSMLYLLGTALAKWEYAGDDTPESTNLMHSNSLVTMLNLSINQSHLLFYFISGLFCESL